MVSIEMFQGASGYCYVANPGNNDEKVVQYGEGPQTPLSLCELANSGLTAPPVRFIAFQGP
jgi:hypothetical protein